MIEGKVKALFSDKERTELLFPITKTSAITNDDGVGLDAIISDTVYSDTNAIKATAVPVNADTLGGKPADEFATQNYVAAEIAKAQLDGGDVDLSGFATKDDVSNAVNGIDFPVDSVNGKTGAVSLSAGDVGATPASHAEDKNNPHGVTPEQIGAHPNTWVPTAEQIGAAPAGYGLGTTAKELTKSDDLNNIWQNGNYWWNWSTPVNAPIFDYDTQGAYGYMRVDSRDDGSYTQTIRSFHAPNIGLTIIRTKTGDTIIEEWFNPPMVPGVEYRTTERWNGKAVYTCLVNCGRAAGDGMTSAYPNLNITQCISCEACSTTGDSFPVKWVDISDIYVNAYANKTAVHIYISGGFSTSATIYAKLRYTKD